MKAILATECILGLIICIVYLIRCIRFKDNESTQEEMKNSFDSSLQESVKHIKIIHK